MRFRSLIGENLMISPHAQQDIKQIKEVIIAGKQKIVFEATK